MEFKIKKTDNSSLITVLSTLFHAATQIHIFHLQTTSFAEHKALNDLYDAIPEFVDGLVETIQGKTDIIKDYKSIPYSNYSGRTQLISYLEKIKSMIEVYRISLPREWDNIDNQLQVVIDAFESCLYKIKFLS